MDSPTRYLGDNYRESMKKNVKVILLAACISGMFMVSCKICECPAYSQQKNIPEIQSTPGHTPAIIESDETLS